MAKNLGINIKIGADLKKFSSDMQNVQRQMRRTGKKMKSIGTSMTRSMTLPLSLIGGASIKLAADFEQSMAKVKAISGATGDQFKRLNDNALELGRTTRYTSAQVADLQLNLSKLGFSPEEIEAATASILNLALATGEDLAASATVAAATMKGFGLEASESARISDVMAAAFSGSALDLEKFGTAMATVAPVAKLAGASLEETTAILGVLTDRGMDASTAGTSLRNIYLRLSQQGLSWAEAMEKVKNAQKPLNVATELFGVRAAAATAIIANNKKQLGELTEELNNSAGAAKSMATVMDKTLNGAILRAKSALEAMGIEIGTYLAPIVSGLADKIAKLSEWFKGLSTSTKKVLLIVAGLLAAAGPLLIIFGQINIAVASLIPVFAKLGVAIVGSLGPIGLIITGVVALGLAIKKLRPKMKSLTHQQKLAADHAKNMRKTFKEVSDSAATKRAELMRLNNTITENSIRMVTRKRAIVELRKAMPNYLKTITDEELLTKGAVKQIDIYIATLKRKAIAVGLQNQVQEKANKLSELEVQKAQGEIVLEPVYKVDEFGNVTSVIDEVATELQKSLKQGVSRRLDDEIAILGKQIDEILKLSEKYKTKGGLGEDKDGDKGGTEDLIKKNNHLKTSYEDLAESLKETGDSFQHVLLGENRMVGVHSKAVDEMKLKNVELLESMNNVKDDSSTWTDIWSGFSSSMNEALGQMNQMIGNFVGEQLTGLFDAIGQEIAGGTKQIDDWSKNLLKSFGEFLSEMGAMVIAYGVAKMSLLKNMHPAAIIAAGIAMTIAGGMIKEKTKDVGSALDGSGGGGGGGSSPIAFNNDFGAGQGMLTLDTVVYGNDIVLSSNRQHNTNMRTRRK